MVKEVRVTLDVEIYWPPERLSNEKLVGYLWNYWEHLNYSDLTDYTVVHLVRTGVVCNVDGNQFISL